MFKNSILNFVRRIGFAHQINGHFKRPKRSPKGHVKLDQIGLVMNCDAPEKTEGDGDKLSVRYNRGTNIHTMSGHSMSLSYNGVCWS